MKSSITVFALLFALGLAFTSCRKVEVESDWTNRMEDLYEHNKGKVSVENGVTGTLSLITGNCMPSIGGDERSCSESPIETTLHIYEYTLQTQTSRDENQYHSDIQTQLVEKVHSDDEGFYEIELPAGSYSVFIEENGNLYANGWDGQGGVNPIEIPSQGVITVNHRIDRAVW